MGTVLVAALVALGLVALQNSAASAMGTVYYVSLDGSNSNVGSLSLPFLTISKCASVAIAGDTCLIRGGTYRETVTPANSGTSGSPITFAPYLGERVVVSGADTFTGAWTNYSGNIFSATATLPLAAPSTTGLFANQVFVDSQMVNEARWPDAGQNLILDQPLPYAATGSNSTTLINSSIPTISGGWTGGTAYFLNTSGYIAGSAAITGTSGTTLTIDSSTQDTVNCAWNCLGTGSAFFLYGKLGALTAAGEWSYDSVASKFYMWAPSGASPTGVEIKTRSYAFDLSGRSNVVVRGLNIFAASVLTSSASTANTLDALNAQYVSHYMTVPFDSSKPYGGMYQFAHQSDTGIILNGVGNTLKNSVVADSAGNGVTLMGTGQTVTNNLILRTDYGMLYNSAIHAEPATSGMVISHNTIRQTGRDGIGVAVGDATKQTWKSNTISYNDIGDFGELNRDLGGVYLCCSLDLSGTEIAHNWLHSPQTHANNGIYLDAGSGNALIDHNVTWGSSARGLVLNVFNSQQGTGVNYANNHVDNNTFTDDAFTSNAANSDSFINNIASNIIGSPAQTTNLVPATSAQFVATGSNDYRILPSSPAVNAGTAIPGVTTNAVGAPDIGAYEVGASDYHPGCSFAQCSAVPVNNGDFEAGNLSGWCNSGSSCSGQTVSTNSPQAGTYDAWLATSGSRLDQVVTGLTPGATYVVTAAGAVATSGKSLTIGVSAFGGATISQSITSSAWTSASVVFIAGSTSTTADVFVTKATGSGSAKVDQVTLTAALDPQAGTNLLQNPGLEEAGPMSGWCNTDAYCTGIVASQGSAHTGSWGAGIGGAGSDLEQANLGLQPYSTYTVTAYAKVATAGEQIWVGVKGCGVA